MRVPKEELGAGEMNELLNKHSCLLGVTGLRNDRRRLLDAEAGSEELLIARDTYRIVRGLPLG